MSEDTGRPRFDPDTVVAASVVEERGRWLVILDFVSPEGAVRHTVGNYHTRGKAEVAARLMQAAAEREARWE